MKQIYSPAGEVELAIIRSLLNEEQILFFVHNDHFGSMFQGPKIALYNSKTIMVREEDCRRAVEIINQYLKAVREPIEEFRPGYSLPDKIRMAVETLLFHWFVPCNKWPRKKTGSFVS